MNWNTTSYKSPYTTEQLGVSAKKQEERDPNSTIQIQAQLPKDFALDVEKIAVREITENIKQSVQKAIFKKSYNSAYYSSPSNYDLQDWVVEYIKEVIQENKDEIIKEASTKLADHMRRSKVVREKFGEMLEEEMK